jgi:hypothetical protein
MLQVLKYEQVVAVQRQVAGRVPLRRVVRVALLRAAWMAIRVAARLEAGEAQARELRVAAGAVRPYAPAGAVAVRVVEAVAFLAVAGYFVAGLVGVFVA